MHCRAYCNAAMNGWIAYIRVPSTFQTTLKRMVIVPTTSKNKLTPLLVSTDSMDIGTWQDWAGLEWELPLRQGQGAGLSQAPGNSAYLLGLGRRVDVIDDVDAEITLTRKMHVDSKDAK